MIAGNFSCDNILGNIDATAGIFVWILFLNSLLANLLKDSSAYKDCYSLSFNDSSIY